MIAGHFRIIIEKSEKKIARDCKKRFCSVIRTRGSEGIRCEIIRDGTGIGRKVNNKRFVMVTPKEFALIGNGLNIQIEGKERVNS